MKNLQTSNMILSHRRCYNCGREERSIHVNACPECGHFMHPIGFCYVPAVNKKGKAVDDYGY